MQKQQLKEPGSYYYEEKAWYDLCPNTLPIIPPVTVEIFPKSMTHREILKEYNITPYNSYAEAAAALIPLIPTLKYPSRIVYFNDDSILYRFHAWRRDDGRLGVRVRRVYLDDEYDAERGVVFSNGLSDTLGSLSSSDSLSLEDAIAIVKSHGLKVIEEK